MSAAISIGKLEHSLKFMQTAVLAQYSKYNTHMTAFATQYLINALNDAILGDFEKANASLCAILVINNKVNGFNIVSFTLPQVEKILEEIKATIKK